MSELSKKARNRTRVQMVLTMLVIVSIISIYPSGKLSQYVSWNSNIDFVYKSHSLSTRNLETIPLSGNGYSDFYLSAEILGEDQCILCKDSGMGYHFSAANEWIPDGGNRVCTD